jgi:hypothetical protein
VSLAILDRVGALESPVGGRSETIPRPARRREGLRSLVLSPDRPSRQLPFAALAVITATIVAVRRTSRPAEPDGNPLRLAWRAIRRSRPTSSAGDRLQDHAGRPVRWRVPQSPPCRRHRLGEARRARRGAHGGGRRRAASASAIGAIRSSAIVEGEVAIIDAAGATSSFATRVRVSRRAEPADGADGLF